MVDISEAEENQPAPSELFASTEQKRPSREETESAIRTLLRWVGENPDREGLKETPERVVKALEEYCSGYTKEPADILNKLFTDIRHYQEFVLMKDIPFYSHCEHHLAPFFGHVHIAYYPSRGVIGLSKLARLVEIYAQRLQTQENMTIQIANALETYLETRGVAIQINAEHMCMTMRGIKKEGAITTTCHFTGDFLQDPTLQARFFSLANIKG